MAIENPYIEFRDGGYWVRGMRVSLDSLIYQWREGLSPETIRECFPVLNLKQVYGAITYYLEHQDEMDEYLKQAEAEEERIFENIRATYPDIHQRMDALRQSTLLPSL